MGAEFLDEFARRGDRRTRPPPTSEPPCYLPANTERVSTFGSAGVRRSAGAVIVYSTGAETRMKIAQRGFAVTGSMETAITAV